MLTNDNDDDDDDILYTVRSTWQRVMCSSSLEQFTTIAT